MACGQKTMEAEVVLDSPWCKAPGIDDSRFFEELKEAFLGRFGETNAPLKCASHSISCLAIKSTALASVMYNAYRVSIQVDKYIYIYILKRWHMRM